MFSLPFVVFPSAISDGYTVPSELSTLDVNPLWSLATAYTGIANSKHCSLTLSWGVRLFQTGCLCGYGCYLENSSCSLGWSGHKSDLHASAFHVLAIKLCATIIHKG